MYWLHENGNDTEQKEKWEIDVNIQTAQRTLKEIGCKYGKVKNEIALSKIIRKYG